MAGGQLWSEWNIRPCEKGCEWGQSPSGLNEKRIRETIAAIPPDVQSVLDAGAGGGWLCGAMVGRFKVVALDLLAEALRYIQTSKTLADLSHLPFADRSFDLVCCCETIEHLDDSCYGLALRGLARVARKYILITVPNDEDLAHQYTKCPKCGTKFSPYGHLRSFREADLWGLFGADSAGKAKCIAVRGIVPVRVWRQSRLLGRLRPERLGFWLAGTRTICPRCQFWGYSRRLRVLWRIWSDAVRVTNGILNPIRHERSCWLLGLYQVLPH